MKRSTDYVERVESRVELANAILKVIASHGQCFFSQNAEGRRVSDTPRISHFVLAANGYLYYVDKCRGVRLFANYEPPGGSAGLHSRNFSDGGTLLALVKNLRDFILRGEPIRDHFGPWPSWICGGDLWGYGDAMETVRRELEPLLAQAEADSRQVIGATAKAILRHPDFAEQAGVAL